LPKPLYTRKNLINIIITQGEITMGIIEEIVAKGLTQAWGLMTPEQKTDIKLSTTIGEAALKKFNKITNDDKVDPVELEAVINDILIAADSTTGRAIQAFFWSLFKSSS
jgi:hypothetical protein